MIDIKETNGSENASLYATQKAHSVNLEDMVPGTKFERTDLTGRVGRWEVITGPYSELPSKDLKVGVQMDVKDSKIHLFHASDFGLTPYSKNIWNRLKVEIILPDPKR